MTNYRKILELHSQECSQRRIVSSVRSSHQTIKTVSVVEQGYKSCVGLTKLGKRYGKKKLEAACERMLAFSSAPSVRTITTLLKNSTKPESTDNEVDNSNKYGITRGVAYWKRGGGSYGE